jgi:hypothetical protein
MARRQRQVDDEAVAQPRQLEATMRATAACDDAAAAGSERALYSDQ